MKLERQGDDFISTWDEYPVRLVVTNISAKAGRFHGEIWAESLRPGQQGVVYWGNVPLDSSRERNGFAVAVADRTRESLPELKAEHWKDMVLVACMESVQAFRSLVTGVRLVDVEVGKADRYLIPGVLPLGETSSILADGGVGKSLLALLIAIAVASGKTLVGFAPVIQGPVLYADWETTEREQAERAWAICRGLGIELPGDLHYYGLDRPLVDLAPMLRAEAARKQAVLVIFDSAIAALDGAAKDDEAAKRYLNCLRSFRPTTRLFLTHITKEESREGAKEDAKSPPSSFGSVFFKNYSRRQWWLDKTAEGKNTTEWTLSFLKKNWGKKPPPISFRLTFAETEDCVTFDRFQDADAEMLYASNPQRVRLALLRARKQLSTSELQQITKIELETLSATLRRMAKQEEIKNFAEGTGRGNEGQWGLLERSGQKPNMFGFSQNGVRLYEHAEHIPLAVGTAEEDAEALEDDGAPF